jgi:hypothetical protein
MAVIAWPSMRCTNLTLAPSLIAIPVTLRKSLTALEIAGYTAGAIVLHPSDFETIELALSTTNAVEHIGLPYDPAQRRLDAVVCLKPCGTKPSMPTATQALSNTRRYSSMGSSPPRGAYALPGHT